MPLDSLAAKADFYLTMSRAFLPPMSPNAHQAFVSLLPEELAEIAGEAGYTLAEELAAYREACAALPDRTALLQLYSALFLMPPREVQLHVAVYLDGAILGGSSDALLRLYARHGVACSDAFHDLPDHLSAVLECLALLYARAAESPAETRAELLDGACELNRKFLLSWVPVMRRHMGRIIDESATAEDSRGPLSPLYLQLSAMLQNALVADAGPLDDVLNGVLDPAASTAAVADKHEMAQCTSCGADIAPAARIRRVKRVLENEGLDTSHLALCPRCRGVEIYPPAQARH